MRLACELVVEAAYRGPSQRGEVRVQYQNIGSVADALVPSRAGMRKRWMAQTPQDTRILVEESQARGRLQTNPAGAGRRWPEPAGAGRSRPEPAGASSSTRLAASNKTEGALRRGPRGPSAAPGRRAEGCAAASASGSQLERSQLHALIY